MPIDVHKALTAEPSQREISWTQRDVLLYHLSLGAGRNAASDPELSYTYERGLRVLPTFAMVAGNGISAGDGAVTAMEMPGIDVDLRKILHAGHTLSVARPIPASGAATVASRIADVWGKGKAAVIAVESAATGEDGELLWTSRMQIWARGEGGFGGEPGPETGWVVPDRWPDAVVDFPTGPAQALLYRLNGDLNPLHADPSFAQAAGFERPILHGLASYGIVGKALVDDLLEGDATRLRALGVRFSGTVFPGETIRIEVWQDRERFALRATCPRRDHAPVLTHGWAEVVS